MEFKTYLVKMNSSPQLNFGLIGVIVFGVSVLCLLLLVPQTISLILSIIGIIMVLIGALSNNGQGLIEVDDKFVIINEYGIEIRSTFYAHSEIDSLEFHFDAYNGQSPFGYFTETSGLIEYGMSNRLSFKNKDSEISEMFYLANQEQSNSFLLTIELLQKIGVNLKIDYRNSSR
jgi:hypothetical protein